MKLVCSQCMIACPERIGSVTLTLNLRLFTVSEPREGWATFQHFSPLWSTIHHHSSLFRLSWWWHEWYSTFGDCTILHDLFFAGLNRQPIWYQPWRRVFLIQYIHLDACCLNLRALLLDWHVKTLMRKQQAAHLDTLVHCSTSVSESFLLHSHRPTYRFHKYCFCMDLRRTIRLVCAGRMLSVSSGLIADSYVLLYCRLKLDLQVQQGSTLWPAGAPGPWSSKILDGFQHIIFVDVR